MVQFTELMLLALVLFGGPNETHYMAGVNRIVAVLLCDVVLVNL